MKNYYNIKKKISNIFCTNYCKTTWSLLILALILNSCLTVKAQNYELKQTRTEDNSYLINEVLNTNNGTNSSYYSNYLKSGVTDKLIYNKNIIQTSKNPFSEKDITNINSDLEFQLNGYRFKVVDKSESLPFGTKLLVKEVSSEKLHEISSDIIRTKNVALEHLMAFDITLYDPQGKEVQPSTDVEVTISGLQYDERSENVVVFHNQGNIPGVWERRNPEKIKDNTDNNLKSSSSSSAYLNEITFTTSHFSIYAVGTTKTHIYNFYVGSTLDETQIVLNGEYLFEPETPAQQLGKRFIGWYIQGATTPINFSQPVSVTADQTYTVEARYEDIWYVYFTFNGEVITTKEVAPGATTNPNGVPFEVTQVGKAFSHWSETTNGPAFDFNAPVNSNKTLYAVLIDRWKVTFESQGGSTVLPQYVTNGSTVTQPANPTRLGYTFARWSLTSTGSAYNFSTPITSNRTLYAVWTPISVNYNVVYWQQNTDNNDYSYVETRTRTGTTGSAATYETLTYTGFTINTAKTDAEVVIIKGDGTSVKNVYYDRNVWTFTIEYRTGGNWITYSTNQVRYGQSTATWYNAAVAEYPNYSWYVSRGSSIAYSEAPTMPNSNFTISGRYAGNNLYTIRYFEANTTDSIKSSYKFYGSGSLYFTVEDGIPIEGFTVTDIDTWEPLNSGTPARQGTIYYTRNNYEILFNIGLGESSVTTTGVPFDSDISNRALAGYTEGVTTKILGGVTYIFGGWYISDSYASNTKFNFAGQKMPARNIVLYAKWAPQNLTVIVNRQSHGGDPYQLSVPYGSLIDPSTLQKTTPPGLSPATDFLGWYWFVGTAFVQFDFNRPVTENVELIPMWHNQVFHVTYNINGGTGTTPVDNHEYQSGSKAAVLSNAGLTPPAGKVFKGWLYNGVIYYPNELLTIPGNVTLVAQWGDLAPETSITYQPNGGSGSSITVNLNNNERHIVKPANTYTRTGYTFAGWNTQANGLGTFFREGSEIIVDVNSPTPNVLYAQWIRITGATSVCVGSNIQLTPQGVPATTNPWTSSNTAVATVTNTGLVTGVAGGSATITFTNINGYSTTTVITVNPKPIVTVSSSAINNTICRGSSTVITGAGANTYSWSPTGGLSAPTGTSVTANPSATTTYTVTGTNTNGCVNSAQISIEVNNINAGQIESNQTICSGGDPAAFTSLTDATGSGTITYRWQKSTIAGCSTGFTDIEGATSKTYDPPSGLTETTYYRRVATSNLNGVSCEAITSCITVSINAVAGGTIASDQTICNNTTPLQIITTSTGVATGTLKYRWESSTTDCNSGVSAISGPTTAGYQPSALTQTTHYRRITTSTYNSVACETPSNCVTITVNNVTAGTISGDQTICEGGDPAAFTVSTAATSPSGSTLTYQWQSSTSATSGYSNIAGATAATYDPPSGLTQTTYYQRIVTSTLSGNSCNVTSNYVTVTVNTITHGLIGGEQTICSGGDPAPLINITAPTGAVAPAYYWEYNTTGCEGTWTVISGATQESYDPGPITQTTYYRRHGNFTLNGVTCTSTSNCISVTVVPDPSITTQPTSNTVCKNSTATLNVVATDGTPSLSYQWQSSANGTSGWTNVGTNANNYNAPTTTQGTTYYRVLVSATGLGCDPVTSDVVSVVVNEAPRFSSCPSSNISAYATTGACNASVNYTVTATGAPAPTITYSFSGATTGSGSGTGSGSTFNVGTTQVTVTANNNCSPDATCTFNVVVNDTIKPTINCPDDETYYVGANCFANGTPAQPTFSDNCAVTTLTWSITKDGTAFASSAATGINYIQVQNGLVGTYVISYTAKDAAGNSATCSFTVYVIDSIPPTITCPSNINVNTDNGQCYATIASLGTPTTSDNCTVATVTNNAPLNLQFPKGTNTVTWTVTDVYGNTATCQQTVTVTDNQAPSITTCPTAKTIEGCGTDAISTEGHPAYNETKTTVSESIFTNQGGQVSNNCTDVLTYSYIDSKTGTCPIVVTRKWTITDESGNYSTCDQTITINQADFTITASNGGSTIHCKPNLVQPTPPTVNDACGNTLTPTVTYIDSPNPIDCEGSRVYTFTYTDCAGHTANWTYTYTLVRQDFASNMPTNTTENAECISQVSVKAAPTVKDVCNATRTIPNSPVVITMTPETGSSYTATTTTYDDDVCFQGTVEFKYTYTDCAGRYTHDYTHTVTVNNTEAPTGTPPANVNVKCIADIPVANAGAVTGLTSNCGGTVSVTTSDSNNGGTGCQSSPYIVTRTYTLTDCSGLTTQYQQTLTAIDNVLPSLTCPSNISRATDAGETYATITIPVPTATDNCGTVTLTNSNGDPDNDLSGQYPIGTTNLTYTATDACGNEYSCTFSVTVTDDGSPQMSCPEDATYECFNLVPGIATTLYEYTNQGGSVSDNGVEYPTSTTIDTTSFTYSETVSTGTCPQTITRKYAVQDFSNNVGECVQTITVWDKTAPTISGGLNTLNIYGCSIADAPAAATTQTALADMGNNLTITDNCTPVENLTITHTDSQNGTCPIVITRTYHVEDACGNSSDVVQTININDTTAPSITGSIANQTIQGCSASAVEDAVTTVQGLLNRFPSISISDNCSAISALNLSHNDVESGSCPIQIVRTYTITDACGNSNSIARTIFIADTTRPSYTGSISQSNIEGCLETSKPAAATTILGLQNLGLNVSDNCTPESSLVVSSNDVITTTSCPITIIRTYTIKDQCNNALTYDHVIKINDTQSPVVTTNPQARDIEGCSTGAITNPAYSTTSTSSSYAVFSDATNGGIASDACGITSVSYQDVSSGSCPIIVTRTWTLQDACGNSKTVNQTISVDDNTKPIISGSISETTIEGCNATNAPTAVTTVLALENMGLDISDACTQDDALVVTSQDATTAGTCQNNITITRTYTITDACGNFQTTNHIIHIGDTHAPVVTGSIKIDTVAGCSVADLPQPALNVPTLEQAGLTITDACTSDAELTVELIDEQVSGTCPIVVTHTKRITDKCGNYTDISRVYHIFDNEAPLLTGTIPSGQTNMNLCFADIPAGPTADDIKAQYTDACGGEISVTKTGTPSGDNCGWSVTYTYVVKDQCNNTVSPSPSITYTGKVQSPPVGTAPAGKTNLIGCYIDGSTPPIGTPAFNADSVALNYSSACGSSVSVTLNSTSVTGNNCAWSVTYDYTVTGACNNKLEHETIVHSGKADGTITGTAPSGSSGINSCYINATTPPSGTPEFNPVTTAAGYSSVCTPAGQLSAELTGTSVTGNNCAWTVTYTFKVFDNCSNELTGQTIQHSGSDETPPIITAYPANTTVCCAELVPAADLNSIRANDNCDDTLSLTKSYADVKINGDCENNFVIRRTFTVEDLCGNTATHLQIITVNDTLLPQLSGIPASTQVPCTEDIPDVPASGVVTATDNCSTLPAITFNEVNEQDSDPSKCGHYDYRLIRTWTATDACGNENSRSQIIKVGHLDDDPPLVSGVITPDTIEGCSVNDAPGAVSNLADLKNLGGATFTLHCNVTDNYFTITHQDSTYGTCPITIKRTYTVTDPCDHAVKVSQIIIIQDKTVPTFNVPPAITIYKDENCSYDIDPSITGDPQNLYDNCDNTLQASYTDSDPAQGSNPTDIIITRTWKVTDDCANETTHTQDITISDQTAPTLTCPTVATSYNLDDNSCFANLSFAATATDNCDSVQIKYLIGTDTITFPRNFSVGATTVKVIAQDKNTNSSQCSFVVNVVDNQPPTIVCPTVDSSYSRDPGKCSTSLSFTSTASDNCAIDTITFSIYGSNITFPYDFPGGTTLVNVEAIDINGVSANCTFNVNVDTVKTPSGDLFQEFCLINNPTVADLEATGNDIKWYSSPFGGTAIDDTVRLVNNFTYYASQTVDGCESAHRLPVTVTIGEPSAPTVANTTQIFCITESHLISDLQPSGLIWYNNESGGTALPNNTQLTSGYYYASQIVDSCESVSRTPVYVNIINITTTATEEQSVSCFGGNDGSALISITGGTEPYTISGDISASNVEDSYLAQNLSVGTYNVIVTDANGCNDTISVTITEPEVLAVCISNDTTICSGNTANIKVSISGGTQPWFIKIGSGSETRITDTDGTSDNTFIYTFNAADLTSDTVFNNLNVIVRDTMNCSATYNCSATVTVNSNPVISGNSFICLGTSGVLTADIADGIWTSNDTTVISINSSNGNINAKKAGNAIITYTLPTGCYDTLHITVRPKPSFTFTSANLSCFQSGDGEITVTGSGGSGSYIYYLLKESSTTPGTYEDFKNSGTAKSGPHTFNSLDAGKYSVKIIDTNGCEQVECNFSN